jgi:hypothetical protein
VKCSLRALREKSLREPSLRESLCVKFPLRALREKSLRESLCVKFPLRSLREKSLREPSLRPLREFTFAFFARNLLCDNPLFLILYPVYQEDFSVADKGNVLSTPIFA